MKDMATVISVGGVVITGIGILLYYGLSGYALDSKPLELIASGLMGFAGGIITNNANDKSNNI